MNFQWQVFKNSHFKILLHGKLWAEISFWNNYQNLGNSDPFPSFKSHNSWEGKWHTQKKLYNKPQFHLPTPHVQAALVNWTPKLTTSNKRCKDPIGPPRDGVKDGPTRMDYIAMDHIERTKDQSIQRCCCCGLSKVITYHCGSTRWIQSVQATASPKLALHQQVKEGITARFSTTTLVIPTEHPTQENTTTSTE